jgi:hypothetical protein
MERMPLYLIFTTGATLQGRAHETYNNRARNCIRSSNYVCICGRHIELQCSRRLPHRQRRLTHTSHRNHASEHPREYPYADHA